MQSCLEIRGMQERNNEIARSDYQYNNQYGVSHPDALATGDQQGKGTGSSGHTFWLPNCRGAIGIFNYTNFDTDPSYGAGNDTDNTARNTAMTRSLYTSVNPYGNIDSSANIADGQYFVGGNWGV